ncbi:MAG: hypothetical protein JWM21_4705 [Acidobacteria bacterium]|nr:hypothetical protein [Acidobacteriota bacterium]
MMSKIHGHADSLNLHLSGGAQKVRASVLKPDPWIRAIRQEEKLAVKQPDFSYMSNFFGQNVDDKLVKLNWTRVLRVSNALAARRRALDPGLVVRRPFQVARARVRR